MEIIQKIRSTYCVPGSSTPVLLRLTFWSGGGSSWLLYPSLPPTSPGNIEFTFVLSSNCLILNLVFDFFKHIEHRFLWLCSSSNIWNHYHSCLFCSCWLLAHRFWDSLIFNLMFNGMLSVVILWDPGYVWISPKVFCFCLSKFLEITQIGANIS